jgi:phage/plasmid-associated DNA primase
MVFSSSATFNQSLSCDRIQIESWVDALFRYAEDYVQLRCFYDKGEIRDGTPLQPWRSVRADDPKALIDVATEVATLAANHAQRVVFAPPVCTFMTPYTGAASGREQDISEGLAISTEIDNGSPMVGLGKLSAILGVPTVVLRSGGLIADPETGEIEEKLHVHWRLTEPTRTPDDYAILKECRRLAKLIADGDGSNVPAVHPVRWAGSWHRKAEPRMAVGEFQPDREVELRFALDALREAVPTDQREPRQAEKLRSHVDRGPAGAAADYLDILSALQEIPNNDLPYESWKQIGGAIWHGTGDTPKGQAAFHGFSEKSRKYDPAGTEQAWRQLCDCPYTQITVGTLYHLAREHNPNWLSPSIRRKNRERLEQQVHDSLFNPPDEPTEEQEHMNTTQTDRTHQLIDELAHLEKTEFYIRLPDAAHELAWKEKRVEEAVRDRRAMLKQTERDAKGQAQAASRTGLRLHIGSDAEIAERVRDDMLADDNLYVHSEGSFYHWTGQVWSEVEDADIEERFVLRYDGAHYGERGTIRLNQSHTKSIMKFLIQKMAIKDFFASRPAGINVANGFIAFDDNGNYTLVPHSPAQLSRNMLTAEYVPGFNGVPPGSLLGTFLHRMFRFDDDAVEKAKVIQEISGSALMGVRKKWQPQPKCIIMHGRTANNGKTETLAVIESLTGGMCSHVGAHQFNERNIVIRLRGALLNTASELTTAQAIASDLFKAAVTCEPLHGKLLYENIVEFRPQAQHVFASNRLPPFAGGLDRGCRRRLLLLEFLRTIPPDEIIPDVANKIIEREFDLLLAWAVEGSARLIRQKGFTVPPSSVEALENWVHDTDPVVAWVRERVIKLEEEDMEPNWTGYKPSYAIDSFYRWAEERHYEKRYLPKLAEFCARMGDLFPGCKRNGRTSRFRDIKIMDTDPPDDADIEAELRQEPGPCEQALMKFLTTHQGTPPSASERASGSYSWDGKEGDRR